jgi:N-acyl-L-homoserine lactone synthetase
LRLLPTTGPTMLGSEFARFFSNPIDFESPTAWECTRFCIHPTSDAPRSLSDRMVASSLLIGLCDLSQRSGIEHIVGLFDGKMRRIYARIGWEPEEIAVAEPAFGELIVGIWTVSESARQRMIARRSGSIAISKAA